MSDPTDDSLSWLVYTSRATDTFDEDRLAELLSQSRAGNRERDVTGVLLYRDGRFLQALEGPVPALARLFGTIALDPRHRDVQVIVGEAIPRRRFPSWAMGYRTYSDAPGSWPTRFVHIFDALADTAPTPQTKQTVHALLDWFRYRSDIDDDVEVDVREA